MSRIRFSGKNGTFLDQLGETMKAILEYKWVKAGLIALLCLTPCALTAQEESHCEEDEQEESICHKPLFDEDVLDDLRWCVERGYYYETALEAALASYQSDDEEISERAFDVLRSLVRKEAYLDQIFAVACKAMGSDSSHVYGHAIYLFEQFFDQGMGYQEAINAVIYFIQSQSIQLSAPAREGDKDCFERITHLYDRLVETRQGAQVALQRAVAGSEESDPAVRLSSLRLFQALLDEGLCVRQAYAAALRSAKDPCPWIREAGCRLYMEFIHEQSDEEIVEFVKTMVQDEWDWIRLGGYCFLSRLVDIVSGQEMIIQEAISMAQDAAKKTAERDRFGAIRLFDALLEKGRGIAEAMEVAENWKNDEREEVQACALFLFEICFLYEESYWLRQQIRELEKRHLDLSDIQLRFLPCSLPCRG